MKCTKKKKKDPKNILLGIAKITMRYKHVPPDLKKAAHILRLGKLHYDDILAAEERPCCRSVSRVCTSKELIECMSETWKLRGDTTDESKTADELTLGNLTNLVKKGPDCLNCGKKGHKRHECNAENKKGHSE